MAERLFRDRGDAGRVLAGPLDHYRGQTDVLVLALPRGGVPVGYEVATALGAPLDVFGVRKLGVPGCEELAMGAIASGGVVVLNDDVVRGLGVTPEAIRCVAEQEGRVLLRREQAYREGRPPPDIAGRTVILVDDGLATGASMRAAIQALRQHRPAKIVTAVPAAPASTCRELAAVVNEVVCAVTPSPFFAVSASYRDFTQTTDEEVRNLLRAAATSRVTAGGQGPTDEALLDLVGDAHFVLIGGASHGTHEFYAARAEMTRRLIGDARATELGSEGELDVGQLVRERHGGDCRLIGFTTYTGTVTAADDWGSPADRKWVRPALADSVEELFHEAGEKEFVLALPPAARATEALRATRLEQAIGVIYRPDTERQSHYVHVRAADQFDALIHIDETRAVEPLERTAAWVRGEVPETYPFTV
ncbi:erythromycin esterase family protein [Planosporangium sp. 12N6]|uniref:phosphoribosyltransferase n=1 Tax=Planosporangium spinosum TaxID=3402278 RepID=UPI003CF7DCF2